MAHLLIAKDYMPPDLLAIRLREELSDDLIVVVGAQIHKVTIDTVVLTVNGLVVLHFFESSEASKAIHPETSSRALARFLADEFPGLQPEVHHLALWLAGGQPPAEIDGRWDGVALDEDVISAIAATVWSADAESLDWDTRRTLAVAFQERRLTCNQRADVPFAFRSGGWLHSSRKAWTIRQVIDHLDHNPEDGIFHLRNGTLPRWFDEQGAAHLVRLARAALQEASGDDRAVLETFLLSTRLVEPPSLVLQPLSLNLGKVVTGETVSTRLTIRRGQGRGYLMGTVRPIQPWVKVEPDRLAEGKLDALIRVDTTRLPIQPQPHTGKLNVITNADTATVTVPVQVQVTALPSPLLRHVLRPALTGAIAGVGGGVLGWWFGSLIAGATNWRLDPIVCAAAVALICAVGSVVIRSYARHSVAARGARIGSQPALLRHAPKHRSFIGWIEGLVAMGLIAAALVVLLRPTPLSDELATAEEWMTVQLEHLETRIDQLTDAWMLRRYDRRAPSQSE